VFFFAGHGIELAGQNYLLPKDIPSIKPDMADLVKRESLPLPDLLDELRAKQTRLNLVILDACRDNPFHARRAGRLGEPEGSQ